MLLSGLPELVMTANLNRGSCFVAMKAAAVEMIMRRIMMKMRKMITVLFDVTVVMEEDDNK